MADKEQMSLVKFRVRDNALTLREFTVAQMINATGLKPESVRTELQRMKQEGLLITEPIPSPQGRRGGRPSLYRLTKDPEKRLALARQVESFFPKPPVPSRPTSRHYLIATRLLDKIAAGEYKDDAERDTLLKQAADALEFAWYDEGEPEGILRAYIEKEKARMKYLAGKHDPAETLFQQVKEAFVTAGLSDEAARAEEYLACIHVWRRLKQEATWDLQGLARAVSETLEVVNLASLSDHPLLALLRELLRSLSRSTREQVLAAAWQQVTTVQFPAVEAIHLEIATLRQRLEREHPTLEPSRQWGFSEYPLAKSPLDAMWLHQLASKSGERYGRKD